MTTTETYYEKCTNSGEFIEFSVEDSVGRIYAYGNSEFFSLADARELAEKIARRVGRTVYLRWGWLGEPEEIG